MCFCDPPEWSSETEDHPWLFTKHSLFYLHRAVTDLCSLPHLSLISDKALFKCLLSWPIHDWRWHLRNNSSVPWYQWGWWVGYGPCPAFKSESLIYLQWEKAVSTATSPHLRLISQSEATAPEVDELSGWSPFVMRTTETAREEMPETEWLTCYGGIKPSAQTEARDAEKSWQRKTRARLMIKSTATAIIFLMRAAGAYNTFIWQRSTSPNSPSRLLNGCTSAMTASSLARSFEALSQVKFSGAPLQIKAPHNPHTLYKHGLVIDSGTSNGAKAETDGQETR